MNYTADIHLHSRWSRATSRDLTPENLHKWSMCKGLSVVGSADFTHPEWLTELKDKLVPAEEGLYRLRPELLDAIEEGVPPACRREVRFLLSVEISSIYKKDGRTRKVHNIVALPSFAAADRLNRRLGKIGNLKSDGRPILGLDCRDLLEICLEACPEVLFIPAHIWTPHFAVLGASSGFDSLEACYGDLLPHIFAVETGLSSDPPMNSRLSMLDRYAVVSNSDAHSPPKLGREATCYDTELSYTGMYEALRTRDPSRFTGTIEFYPEQGKYHLDGHRKCGICWSPRQTLAADGTCPECGRKLTVGVQHRVELLADRQEDEPTPVARSFEYLIPLDEVIASCVGVGPKSKRVQGVYHDLLQQLGPELDILRHVDPERIAQCGQPLVAEGVRRMRTGRVAITPGYDGEYGVIQVFTAQERRDMETQSSKSSSVRAVGAKDVAAADVVQRLATQDEGQGRVRRLLTTAEHANSAAAEFDSAHLDAAQQQAVRADDGPVMVVGSAGAGKTHTLVHRVVWLLGHRGVTADRIVVLSPTRQGARLVGACTRRMEAGAEDVAVETIQSLAIRLMQELTDEPIPTQIDEVEALNMLHDVIAVAPAKPSSLRLAHERIRHWKTCGLRPIQVAKDPLAMVYAGYQERLRVCGAQDADDVLLDLVERLRGSEQIRLTVAQRFQHVLVDEYQELTALQLEFVQMLAAAGRGLFVTGDPGRCGHDLSARLQQDYGDAQICRLADNYRSESAIAQASSAMLDQQTGTQGGGAQQALALSGESPTLQFLHTDNEMTEAEVVAAAVAGDKVHRYGDMAVLTRTGEQLTLIETSLSQLQIPYRTVGETAFLQARGARDAVAFFRYALDPTQPLRLIEALRTGPFDIGPAALERLSTALGSTTQLQAALEALPTTAAAQVEGLRRAAEGYARRAQQDVPAQVLRVWQKDLDVEPTPAFERLLGVAAASTSMVDLLHRVGSGDATDVDYCPEGVDAVTLMTIPMSMGLEFPVVFICGVEDGLLPLRNDDRTLSVDQERQLFYLALTRARKRVLLSCTRQRTIAGRLQSRFPSPFLADIPAHLLAADQLMPFDL